MKKRKTTKLTIRLTAAERRAIVAAAEEEHVPASIWVRQVVLGRVAEKRPAKARRARVADLVQRMSELPRFDRGDEERAAKIARLRGSLSGADAKIMRRVVREMRKEKA